MAIECEDRPEIRAVVQAALNGRVSWRQAIRGIEALAPSLPPAEYEEWHQPKISDYKRKPLGDAAEEG